MPFLPSELKYLIAELLSPNSLAALARTHSTYQREAEKALYSTLYITSHSNDSLKCMETLATNSEKAALVRFLYIKYACVKTKKNRQTTMYLSKSLINMHSLFDFRVIPCHGEVDVQSTMELCNILCQGHFQLRTFYCPALPSIVSRIIRSQTELQMLGLYTSGRRTTGSVLKSLKELHNAQLLLPIVVTLELLKGFIIISYNISIFPAFYSANRRATIHQVLAQSFGMDQSDNNYMLTKVNDAHELSIYLIDPSEMPSIYALAKDMAVSFPSITLLNLWFERHCEPLQFFIEKFSLFSNLSMVRQYDFWPPSLADSDPEDGWIYYVCDLSSDHLVKSVERRYEIVNDYNWNLI